MQENNGIQLSDDFMIALEQCEDFRQTVMLYLLRVGLIEITGEVKEMEQMRKRQIRIAERGLNNLWKAWLPLLD